MLSFTQQQTLYGKLSQNNSATNLALGAQLMNIEHRYLLQKFFNNERSYTSLTVSQQQFYKLPPNYSKLKTLTVTIGSLKYTPIEVNTRAEWDRLNVFPYYGDIPQNIFIYNGQIGIWPIPSTAGNTISFNYKIRVPDLSLADDTTGTVSVAASSTAVTGSATAFVPTVSTNNETRWIQIAQPKGDNLWYQISSVDTTTGITLFDPYYGTTAVSGGTFTIGQMPLLDEDFHDMLVLKALIHYYSSVVDNKVKKEEFQGMYDAKLELLSEYSGQKTVSVNLGRHYRGRNPNLYQQNLS